MKRTYSPKILSPWHSDDKLLFSVNAFINIKFYEHYNYPFAFWQAKSNLNFKFAAFCLILNVLDACCIEHFA